MSERYQNGKIYKLVSGQTQKVYYGSTCDNLAKRLYRHHDDYNRYSEGKRKWCSTSREILKYNNAQIVLVELYPCNSKMELERRERWYIENNDCVNKIVPTRTQKEYYETNKEHISERRKKDYQENREERLKQLKEYAKKNKTKITSYHKEYREKNKEKLTQKHKSYVEAHKNHIKQYHSEYRQKNADTLKEKSKKRYEENKERYSEQGKLYREKNKEKLKAQKKKYHEANKDTRSKKQKVYRELNKEKIYAHGKEYIFCECGEDIQRGGKARHRRSKKHNDAIEELLKLCE